MRTFVHKLNKNTNTIYNKNGQLFSVQRKAQPIGTSSEKWTLFMLQVLLQHQIKRDWPVLAVQEKARSWYANQ